MDSNPEPRDLSANPAVELVLRSTLCLEDFKWRRLVELVGDKESQFLVEENVAHALEMESPENERLSM
jgi:hypothetical protein